MTDQRAEPHPLAIATLYARRCVSGRVVVGGWMRKAAQRFLDDLKASRVKGSTYVFSRDRARQDKGGFYCPRQGLRAAPKRPERAALMGGVRKARSRVRSSLALRSRLLRVEYASPVCRAACVRRTGRPSINTVFMTYLRAASASASSSKTERQVVFGVMARLTAMISATAESILFSGLSLRG